MEDFISLIFHHLQKKVANLLKISYLQFNFADRTGLEPATSAVTGRHSNQLNYRSKKFRDANIGVYPIFPANL